tara:strand:- start:1431 stop:1808 length:378 start_codon:yes stop_codon:yes gene_type:complete
MSYSLYTVLPTEIVWKIYEDTHRLRIKDLHNELNEAICYAEGRETPFHCHIGECDCVPKVINGKVYHHEADYHWDLYGKYNVRPIIEAHQELKCRKVYCEEPLPKPKKKRVVRRKKMFLKKRLKK